MRRWRTRMLICLALGVVTTVIITAACVIWVTPPGEASSDWRVGVETSGEYSFILVGSRSHLGGNDYAFIAPVEAEAPQMATLLALQTRSTVRMYRTTRDAPSFTQAAAYRRTPSTEVGWDSRHKVFPVLDFTRGLPMRVLHGRYRGSKVLIGYAMARNEARPGTEQSPIVIPTHLLWPGFLIDTLFYGAIWFALLFGFGAARGARHGLRRKRGLCPMCAYDLRGGAMGPAGSRASPAGCPECGWNRSDDQPPGEAGD